MFLDRLSIFEREFGGKGVEFFFDGLIDGKEFFFGEKKEIFNFNEYAIFHEGEF